MFLTLFNPFNLMYIFLVLFFCLVFYISGFIVNVHVCLQVQGRSQVSEHDEASLERRRREALGGSGGMPPENFEI